jgi:hypothetical protein
MREEENVLEHGLVLLLLSGAGLILSLVFAE